MKNKRLNKIVCWICAFFTSFAFFACDTGTESSASFEQQSTPDSSSATEEITYYKGVGEPFAGSTITGFNYQAASELLGSLGSKTFRMWLSDSVFYSGYSNTLVFTEEQLSTISRSGQIQISQYISTLKANGIEEIVGLGNFLPKVESTAKYNVSNNYVPDISTDENSDYSKFLNKVYVIYKTVSAAFPEITVWEMGNEYNQNTFLSKVEGSFTQEELAHINVDYMYYATKGVREGNPAAITIPAGYAPIEDGMPSIARFYEMLYTNIESGNFPTVGEKSVDKRDYFDGLCWHAYDIANGMTTWRPAEEIDFELWKSQNDEIYNVAVKHGDAGIKAWITEFGFTLLGSNLKETTAQDTSVTRYKLADTYYDLVELYEQYQADYCKEYFKKMDEMKYLNSVHFFRLFCSEQGMQWNGFGEVYFGLFLEPDDTVNRGFYPRKKAYAIQEIFGGTGDLTKYA